MESKEDRSSTPSVAAGLDLTTRSDESTAHRKKPCTVSTAEEKSPRAGADLRQGSSSNKRVLLFILTSDQVHTELCMCMCMCMCLLGQSCVWCLCPYSSDRSDRSQSPVKQKRSCCMDFRPVRAADDSTEAAPVFRPRVHIRKEHSFPESCWIPGTATMWPAEVRRGELG